MRVHLDAYAQPDNPVRSALRYTHEPYFDGATSGLGWNVNDTGGVVTLGHSGVFAWPPCGSGERIKDGKSVNTAA
jgi:hypothetical protein